MQDAQDVTRAQDRPQAADTTAAAGGVADAPTARDATAAPASPVGTGMAEPELDRLSERDLGQVQRQAAEIAEAAPAVDELFRAVGDSVAAERESRTRSKHAVLRLPTELASPPDAIVRDQREAMVRAIRLREDGRLSDAARSVWAAVVARLARLRRDSKGVIAARRRRAGPDESGWLASEGASQEAARGNEVVPAVPTESGPALEHLGADARAGGDLGRPVGDAGPRQGSQSDPTVNPHSRA